MVDEAAGRRDKHVEPICERPNLRSIRHASEYDRDLDIQPGRQIAETLPDLAGEFTRRRKHERARAQSRRRTGVEDEAIEDWQGERGGLAGSRLRDADEVAALKEGRNGLGLNGSRFGISERVQRGLERRGQAEAVEIMQVVRFRSMRTRRAVAQAAA